MVIRNVIPAAILAATIANSQTAPVSERAQARIAKEARHEILSLPHFDVFDNIEFRVDGYNVTLMGQVTRPTLKTDAETVVKEIEGVENVTNQIELLPLSPNDDRLRVSATVKVRVGRMNLMVIAPSLCLEAWISKQTSPCVLGRNTGSTEP